MLFAQRMGHICRNPPSSEMFADGVRALRYVQAAELPANHLAKLSGTPVLYFALVPLLLVTRHGEQVRIALGWLHVALRLIHSVIHIGRGRVQARFLIYLASCAVCSATWIGLAADMPAAPRI